MKPKDIGVLVSSLIVVMICLFILTRITQVQSLRVGALVVIAIIVGVVVYKYEMQEPKATAITKAAEKPKRKNIKDLEKGIKRFLKKGVTRQQIVTRFKQNWSKIDIEEALLEVVLRKYNLHIPHKDVRAAVRSVEKMREHKIPDLQIQKSMVRKGWPEKVVKEALFNSKHL